MSNAYSNPIQYEFVMFADESYHKVPKQILITEIEQSLRHIDHPSNIWHNNEIDTAITAFKAKQRSEQVEELLAMFVKRCEESCPPWKLQEGEDPVEQARGWLVVGFSETLACAALGRVEV